MGYTITRDEPTPNPSARRLVVDPEPGRIASCRSKSEPSTDPLAAALIAIDDITSVLVHESFISVTIVAGSRWDRVKPKVAQALENADG